MTKHTKRNYKLGICALLVACAACSQEQAEPLADETAVAVEPSKQEQKSKMTTPSNGDNLTNQVSGAVADLSARTGITSSAIKVSEARIVQWGSSAVGCPKEGMNYTQAMVPGVLVILEADDVSYRYHGRSESALVYCPDERAQEPAYGPGKEFM